MAPVLRPVWQRQKVHCVYSIRAFKFHRWVVIFILRQRHCSWHQRTSADWDTLEVALNYIPHAVICWAEQPIRTVSPTDRSAANSTHGIGCKAADWVRPVATEQEIQQEVSRRTLTDGQRHFLCSSFYFTVEEIKSKNTEMWSLKHVNVKICVCGEHTKK